MNINMRLSYKIFPFLISYKLSLWYNLLRCLYFAVYNFILLACALLIKGYGLWHINVVYDCKSTNVMLLSTAVIFNTRPFCFLKTFHGGYFQCCDVLLSCCSLDGCACNACVLISTTLADNQTAEGALTAGRWWRFTPSSLQIDLSVASRSLGRLQKRKLTST